MASRPLRMSFGYLQANRAEDPRRAHLLSRAGARRPRQDRNLEAGSGCHPGIVAETAGAALCLLYGFEPGFQTVARRYVASYAGLPQDQVRKAVFSCLSDIHQSPRAHPHFGGLNREIDNRAAFPNPPKGTTSRRTRQLVLLTPIVPGRLSATTDEKESGMQKVSKVKTVTGDEAANTLLKEGWDLLTALAPIELSPNKYESMGPGGASFVLVKY